MPDQNEKEKRKQIMNELRQKAQAEFEQNLPMSRENFKELFDYLDVELGNSDCNDTLKLTRQFLQENGIQDIDKVDKWLGENGGYCDCEVLANVEGLFE